MFFFRCHIVVVLVGLLAAAISKTREKQKFTKALLDLTVKSFITVRMNIEHINGELFKNFQKYLIEKKTMLVGSIKDIALISSWKYKPIDHIEYFLNVSIT